MALITAGKQAEMKLLLKALEPDCFGQKPLKVSKLTEI